MSGLLEGLLMCEEHHCPMIVVPVQGETHYACVLEYVDSHLGRKRVRAVVRRSIGDDTAVSCVQFEDGHLLPLYCPCCGEPLGVRDRAQFERNIVGTYLLALAYAPAEGQEPECLVFVFSTDAQAEPEDADREPLSLHLNSARHIVCPDDQPAHSRPLPRRAPRECSGQ